MMTDTETACESERARSSVSMETGTARETELYAHGGGVLAREEEWRESGRAQSSVRESEQAQSSVSMESLFATPTHPVPALPALINRRSGAVSSVSMEISRRSGAVSSVSMEISRRSGTVSSVSMEISRRSGAVSQSVWRAVTQKGACSLVASTSGCLVPAKVMILSFLSSGSNPISSTFKSLSLSSSSIVLGSVKTLAGNAPSWIILSPP